MVGEDVYLEGDWWPEPLPRNAQAAARTYMSTYSFLHYRSEQALGVSVDEDTGIYTGTQFDIGPLGQVRIGRYCTIVSVVFSTNGLVEIGDHALISHEVYIVDDAFAVPPADRTAEQLTKPSPPILIGDAAWVGTRVVLLPGCRLGEGAIVGAGAVVDFEVPDFAVVAGNPARIVGWSRPGYSRRPAP